MIEPEKVFNQLITPLIESDDIGKYHYGNEDEVRRLFNLKAIKYPVVWFVMPYTAKDLIYKDRVEVKDVKIILASSTRKEITNDLRNLDIYDTVLVPLYDKIKSLMLSSQLIDVDNREISFTKIPNYHTKEVGTRANPQNRIVYDYWDVITMNFTATFKNKC